MQFADIDDLRVIANEIKKKANTTDLGTAASANTTNSITQGSGDVPTAGAVWTAIDNLPEPLVFKGTLGTGGTITALPTAAKANEGYLYKVITAGTYAGQSAKVDDRFACATLDDGVTYEWVLLPAGDSDSDTWRGIKVNGTEQIGSALSTGDIDFINGTNTTVGFNASGNKISVNVDLSNYIQKSSTSGLLKNDGAVDTTAYAKQSEMSVSENNDQTTIQLKSGTSATVINAHQDISGKVDKVNGKDLSTNDYTTDEKNKLAGIASGAEVNVQSDWNQTTDTADDYIKNKPILGTAAAKNVPASGDASSSEVVLGNDTRLTDSRNAKDVYAWAKAETKPTYTKSEVGLGNVDNTSDETKKTNFTGSIANENTGFVTGGDAYTELAKKVDKVDGKGLSTNDYDDTAKGIVDGVTSALANKADKSEMSISTSGDQTTIQLKSGTSATVINAHQDISGKANKSEMSVSTSGDKTTIQLKSGTSAEVLNQHQDISGKADKSEMSVTDGTGADADKTTIQLKSDTSATVLKTHQDISGKADKVSGATNGNLAGLDANGNLTDSGVAKSDIDEMQDELSTDYVTIEGNPLNFTTLSAQTAKSTILSVEPIQDLHGFTKPWVGGAGKNKIVMTLADIKAASVAGTWSGNVYTHNNVVYTVNTDNDGNVISVKVNGTNNSGSSNASLRFSQRTNHPQSLPTGSYLLSSGVTTGTNNISLVCGRTYDGNWQELARSTSADASFSVDSSDSLGISIDVSPNTTANNLVFYPMIRLSSVSDATFEPYSNICPISGYDEVDINGCGENLVTSANIIDGAYVSGGTPATINSGDAQMCYVIAAPNTTYTISKRLSARFTVSLCDELPAVGVVTYNRIIRNEATSILIETQATTKYICIYYYAQSADTLTAKEIFDTLKVELGSQATPYTPYQQSNNISIQLDNTVYGGKLDVEKGELVVDMGMYELSDCSWAQPYQQYTVLKTTDIPNVKYVTNNREVGNGISENYAIRMPYGMGSVIGYIAIDVDCVTVNMGDTTYQPTGKFVYELATPTTIQLTPHQIDILKGINTITTNADNITLQYRNGEVATLEDIQMLKDTLLKLINSLSS